MSAAVTHRLAHETPLSVIVVDDDLGTATAMKRVVESLGYACRLASDGTQAIAMIDEAPADVIVSDNAMPGIDGVTLCHTLRGRAHYVYFVLVTALDDKRRFADAIRAGVDDYITKPIDVDVLAARLLCAERVVGLQRALRKKNLELRRDSQRNFESARIDPLTRAHNRLALTEDLRLVREHTQRYRDDCAVVMCDVDLFKAYNDAFGHLAGDEALRRVVKTIEDELRRGDTIYRFGGEEFVVLLPHQTIASAHAAMERTRRAVESLGIQHPIRRSLTISIGVAALRPADTEEDECLRRADAALYRAKSLGRNCVSD